MARYGYGYIVIGYPPDMEMKATETVIEQAKLLADDFSSKPYESGDTQMTMAAEQ